ncbi:hypothetical protein [Rhodococcus sp. IEGM1428]|uniref:hypothetical protein n=1 Tax=Rhodococcus sp. IEGM1428 TaxID=3392191 RepID=UPI003D09C27E
MTGRKPKLTALQHERLLKDYESGEFGAVKLMELYGLSRSAVYAALIRAREQRDAIPSRTATTRSRLPMITAPADRYATDSLEKAQFARTYNELGEPWPAWSTGQHLTVAVLLQDMRKLADLDYTEVDALERLRYDIELPDLNAAAQRFADLRDRL